MVTTIAQGIIELKTKWQRENPSSDLDGAPLPLEIQSFLDRFYMSRIGIRMLIGMPLLDSLIHSGQHLALSNPENNANKDFVGIINPHTQILSVTQDAAENAKFICQDFYGLWGGPEVRFIGKYCLSYLQTEKISRKTLAMYHHTSTT